MGAAVGEQPKRVFRLTDGCRKLLPGLGLTEETVISALEAHADTFQWMDKSRCCVEACRVGEFLLCAECKVGADGVYHVLFAYERDAMIDMQEKTEVFELDGRIESVYVYFRTGVQIKEALRFKLDVWGRVLVYVGTDGVPVAFQFVDGWERTRQSEDESDSIPAHQAKLMLFGIASKMVAFFEAGRQRLGDVLIKDAIEVGEKSPDLFDPEEEPDCNHAGAR